MKCIYFLPDMNEQKSLRQDIDAGIVTGNDTAYLLSVNSRTNIPYGSTTSSGFQSLKWPSELTCILVKLPSPSNGDNE